MVDIAKAKKSLEDYFENVTKEQFTTDLKKFCPELFEKETEAQNDSTEPRLPNTKLEGLEQTEIDRHKKT